MENQESKKRLLTKKDLNKLAFSSAFLQSSFNYERMQGTGWVWTIAPGLRKIYKDDEEGLRASMKTHVTFFNCHPFLNSLVSGIVLALEENKAPLETVQNIKVALMGPLGGIGDSILWLTALPLIAGISAQIALQTSSIMGAIIFLVLFNTLHLSLRFGLMHYGYDLGINAVGKIKDSVAIVNRAASIVGLMVVGSLIPQFVHANIGINVVIGEMTVNLQETLLDPLMPGMLALVITYFLFRLYKRGIKPLTMILVIIGIGLLGSITGILV